MCHVYNIEFNAILPHGQCTTTTDIDATVPLCHKSTTWIDVQTVCQNKHEDITSTNLKIL